MKFFVVLLSLLVLACGSSMTYGNQARVVSISNGLMNLQIYDQSYHVLPLLPGVQVGDTIQVVINSDRGVLEIQVEGVSGE
jgi:hypothetical protein